MSGWRNPGLAIVTALWLAGCGWHLRGAIPGGSEAKNLFVSGIATSHPFYSDFSQILGYSGGKLAKAPSLASAVVHISQAKHERRSIALNKQGKSNTYDLTFRLVYDIRTPQGEILVPTQELDIRRDYFNDQSSPLGQGEEEASMRTEMQREAAQALFRRVVYMLNRKPAQPS